ncbi:hypothetical protein LOTGIDRAFT_237018, partial [Lottia gigantea]
MATKRPAPAEDAGSSGASASKKQSLSRLEPLKLGSICSLEELDMKVLHFQNKKLGERIEQRKKAEGELKKRIEQLENRQRTDDKVLMIVNRYWNQLDEDVRVLLQRLDAETADEDETKNESSETSSFLTLLSTWDKQELEDKLSQRVEFSKRAISKLLQAVDHLLQRNDKLHSGIVDKVEKDRQELLSNTIKAATSGEEEKKEEEEKKDEEKKDEEKDEKTEEKDEEEERRKEFELLVKEELTEVRRENKQLHNLVTQLHQRHHEHTLKISEMQDKITASETEIAEFKNKVDDLEYEYEKAGQRAEKLDRHLADALQKLTYYEETGVTVEGVKVGAGGMVSNKKLDEIFAELEEQKELAGNRLTELEKLSKDHQEAMIEIEKLKLDLQHLPENIIIDTTEYKCMQSQFSVLYNEYLQMKNQLEETKGIVTSNKNAHLRQIEQME